MIPNPFPLNITPKVNSPQLLAWLAQYGDDKYADSEFFNKIVQALNYLYENLGSGGGSSLFLGDHVSLEALQTAHPNPIAGNTANIIVEGAANDLAVWDNDDSSWIVYPGAGYSFTTPSFQETTDISPTTTNAINVGGLTITDKINFITGLITQIRNVRFQDKDGDVAYTSDIATLSQTTPSKQSAELLLLNADVVQGPGLPRISGLTKQGHNLTTTSRIIVTEYNVPGFNGIYRIGSGPDQINGHYNLTRVSDANTSASLNNAIISVTNGTFAGKTFRQTTPNPVVNTTAIAFEEFGGASVAFATNILAGIAKLYNGIGTETDGGITPNAVLNALNALNPLNKRLYYDDFVNLGDNGIGLLTVSAATLESEGGLSNIIKIGGGTSFTKMPAELNRDGILRATIGNINGSIRIRHSNLWIKSTDSVMFASNFRIQTLSTVTERYTLSFRFFNDNNNFITCTYSDNTNSGRFQFITSLAGVTTTVNTSVNVAINTWYDLEIILINGVATLFINGVAELPISTNILLNASYDVQCVLTKTVSQANAPRTVDFDFILFKDL
ncbi:hypothetical protein [Flavobacterium sp.]|uniref:hypothetical protein n=1 Tax=Flavobacterium sp. TaxID=239 RepID=UPI0026053D92|nr:hypothetical protein [Flavobacterium sp.]